MAPVYKERWMMGNSCLVAAGKTTSITKYAYG